MIDYLERLERDLVDAIDRRATAPARRRHRRPAWRGRDWAPAVTAAVALLAIAVTVALVELTSTPPTVDQGQPRPVIELRLDGDPAQVGPTMLQARARGPGGDGTLTINATARLIRPCCETPPRPEPGSTRMPFTWKSDRGSLSGCIPSTPDGHFVLDNPARITAATGALRRYRGRDLRIAGELRPLLLDQLNTPRGTSRSSQTRVAAVPAPGC